jgi:hypothetical protein
VAGKIFISYSQKQSQPTGDVAAFLRSEGYSVWTDTHLIPGDRREVIDDELNAADAVVVIWTNDSVVSDWVISEAEHGRGHSKLIPLKTRDLTAPIPKPFDAFHTCFIDDRPAILAAVRRAADGRPSGAVTPVTAPKRLLSATQARYFAACLGAILAGLAGVALYMLSRITESRISSPPPPEPVNVHYKFCTGEHRQRCPSDAIPQDCGFSVADWAKANCTSYATKHLDTFDGNRCGYSIDQVICTSPKTQ